jgi:putative component of membrane protein insertase Oxa1/YidC/SpoIIIJ protein YidD
MKTPFLNKAVIFLIVGLRPLFGVAHCRYEVSCTKFATEQLQKEAFVCAMWHIIKRVLSCSPLS